MDEDVEQEQVVASQVGYLAQWRRKVRQSHVCGLDLLHDLSVRLGFFPDTLPLGVILERLPVRGSGFPAGMLKDVDQSIALLGIVERRPVRHALQAVPIEYLDCVLTETRF